MCELDQQSIENILLCEPISIYLYSIVTFSIVQEMTRIIGGLNGPDDSTMYDSHSGQS